MHQLDEYDVISVLALHQHKSPVIHNVCFTLLDEILFAAFVARKCLELCSVNPKMHSLSQACSSLCMQHGLSAELGSRREHAVDCL